MTFNVLPSSIISVATFYDSIPQLMETCQQTYVLFNCTLMIFSYRAPVIPACCRIRKDELNELYKLLAMSHNVWAISYDS